MSDNILLFSDLHLHAHKRSVDRLKDCLQVLEWVFQTALDRKTHDILFLGDLFHDRTKLEVMTIHRVMEVFEKYFGKDSPLNLYLMLGNHDLWHRDKRDIYSPKLLSMIPGITIIDQPKIMYLGKTDTRVDFLPFTENPINDLDNLRNNKSPAKERKLLCAHLAIDGAVLNSSGTQADVVVEHDGDMMPLDASFLAGWNKVFLGHYHAEQTLNDRVEYIGSPLQLSFSEAFQQKHIIEFDLETFQKELIVNDFSPVHLILKPEDIGKHSLTGNFVSIRVDDMASTTIVDIRKDITDNHDVGTLEISPVKKPWLKDEDLIIDAKSILYEEEEMMERYIKDKAEDGLDAVKLLETGRECVRKQPVA